MEIDALSPLLPRPLTAPETVSEAEEQAVAGAAADFESFLTLLTAQLKNQDPLQPLESTEFVAQLANFSTVEQLIDMNTQIDALTEQSVNADVATFASWIGREVTTTDGFFTPNGSAVSFDVPEVSGTARVEAVISDREGKALRTFTVTPDSNGRASWDGRNDRGAPVSGQEIVMTLRHLDVLGTALSEQKVDLPREVVAIRGTATGLLLDLDDGTSLSPTQVNRLSTPGENA